MFHLILVYLIAIYCTIVKHNFIFRQEELEASNGDDKKGRSKYGAKKVNDIESKEFFELSTF